jgi:hypothetical protein
MTSTLSRSRQAAETAFAKVQTQFLLRKPANQGCDPIIQARLEKTLRLRTARLAKEAEDLRGIPAAPISLSTKKA